MNNLISKYLGSAITPEAISTKFTEALSKKSPYDLQNLTPDSIKSLLKSAIVDAHTDVANSDKDSKFWSEPKSAYNPTYPHNHITETESGHVFELDDSKGAERVHLAHRSGTFVEMHPDGTRVDKIVKDNYTIVLADNKIAIYGNANITVQKDATVYVQQNCNMFIDGDMNLKVKNNFNMDIGKNVTWRIGGQMSLGVEDKVTWGFKTDHSWSIGQNATWNILGDTAWNFKGTVKENCGGEYVGNYTSGYKNNAQLTTFSTPTYYLQAKTYLNNSETQKSRATTYISSESLGTMDIKSSGNMNVVGSPINLNT